MEQIPADLVAASPPVGIRGQQQLHAIAEVGAGRLEHQVEMIGHQQKGVEAPPRMMNDILQPEDESPPVRIIPDDVLPGVGPNHDVVNRISILESKAATHGSIGPQQQSPCKNKLRTKSDLMASRMRAAASV